MWHLQQACWPLQQLAYYFHSSLRKWNNKVSQGLVSFFSLLKLRFYNDLFLTPVFYFFWRTSRSKPIIDASKPLPPQATFRGPYVNTGSHDIGPDTTTYTKKWLFFLVSAIFQGCLERNSLMCMMLLVIHPTWRSHLMPNFFMNFRVFWF